VARIRKRSLKTFFYIYAIHLPPPYTSKQKVKYTCKSKT